MQAAKTKLKEEIVEELEGLSKGKLQEILGFVSYVKAKDAIDPTQTYFWTKGWQAMEAEVEKDKEAGKTIGNGTTNSLLKSFKP